MNHRRSFLLVLTAALLTGCGAGGPPPPSAPSPLLGKPLPTVRRPTIAGGRISQDDTNGHTVVIKFFAKYCEPCKRTLPVAQRLHQQRGEVVFIGISEDERTSEAQELVGLYGLTFPVVHDQSNVLAGKFRVNELPVTFVADRRGTIRYVLGPGHDDQALERVLDSLE